MLEHCERVYGAIKMRTCPFFFFATTSSRTLSYIEYSTVLASTHDDVPAK